MEMSGAAPAPLVFHPKIANWHRVSYDCLPED